MSPFMYLFAVVPGALALASIWLGGAWLLMTPLFVFVLVPVVELFLKGTEANADAAADAARRKSGLFDAVLYTVVPLHFAILGSLLWVTSTGDLAVWELVASAATAGISCGAYGLNVGHELGHRKGGFHRAVSKALNLSTIYGHFYIEHNRGHHARVATPEDPASAREGQWLPAFWLRSVTGGWRSAWRIEAERLERKGQRVVSWDNEMVRLQVAQVLVLVAVFGLAGPAAGAAFVIAGVAGILLLETVNYVEHYGLQRERLPNGRYERVRPAHSWNSNRPFGRALLFDLTRHADHHAYPARPYAVLRHFDDAPQLPTGYPGMILLALVPPLYIWVMDRHMKTEQVRLDIAA
jgi:alkane 1-monooxygenase